MAVSLEGGPQQSPEAVAPDPAPPIRSSRWAWLAIVASPAFAALAIWMSFFVLGDENIGWWGDVTVLLLVFAPPLVGAGLGARSARAGSQPGVHAVALGGAWIGLLLVFWVMANYPYSGESGLLPISYALITGAVVAAGVEGWYWLRVRRSRTH
jgi:hypothetical protein